MVLIDVIAVALMAGADTIAWIAAVVGLLLLLGQLAPLSVKNRQGPARGPADVSGMRDESSDRRSAG